MQTRPATADDARSIAEVHTASWRAIYRGHFPAAYLANIDVEGRERNWQKVVLERSGEVAVLDDGGVVGFIHICPARDSDADAATLEVSAIYLAPEHWRRGYGRQLIHWALDRSDVLAADRVSLWVLDGNHRARRFYESMGFHWDGASKEGVLGDDFRYKEVRYVYEVLRDYSQ